MDLLSSRIGFPSPLIFSHRNPSSKPPITVAMCGIPSSRPPIHVDVGGDNSVLKIGSPVIIIDAPATLKTANSITCMKANGGQVKTGDVGRLVCWFCLEYIICNKQ